MIREVCPIILLEKLTQLCWKTMVLCALQFHSLETSCFSRWGLALVSQLLTSTSFGWSWWPVAGLQLCIWPSLPLQSADVGPKLCLLTPGSLALTCKAVRFRCNTGALLFCVAAVVSWVDLFMSVIHSLIFLSVFMKQDSFSSLSILLARWTLMSCFCFSSNAILQLFPANRCYDSCCLKIRKISPAECSECPQGTGDALLRVSRCRFIWNTARNFAVFHGSQVATKAKRKIAQQLCQATYCCF